MTDERLLFYDFEVFYEDWMVVLIEYESRKKTVIKNNIEELRQIYEHYKDDIWIGYNSRMYDQFILKGLLLDYDPYYVSQQIINEDRKGYHVVPNGNSVQLYNFDISTGFHSLKQLEGFMGSTIKESDVSFDIQRKLTDEELEQTEFYCTHDVEETIKVFDHLREEFDSHLLVIKAFGLPMETFNKTKAQMASIVLEAKRSRDRNDEFDISIPDTLILSDKYKHIAEWYLNPTNRNYSKSLITEVAGIPHVFAWGGLHAARPNYVDEGMLVHVDVSSLYPSLIIEYDYMSRNVPSVEKYKQIRDKRMQLKEEKNPMQLPFKIILNATYGCFKDKANALYDPLQSNNVCICGQLLMLDLIDKIEDYCTLIQSNTDGLILKVKSDEQLATIKELAAEWEQRTRLNLEWDMNTKIVQKDVNNYLIVGEDGDYESKGAYIKKLKPIDYDLPIINKALKELFMFGTPVEETISNCNLLHEFQKIVRVSNLYKGATYGEEPLKEKALRVFASNDPNAKGVFKINMSDGLEKIANTPDMCFIYNDEVLGKECPPELDRNYYVELAKKRVDDFLVKREVSATAKFKSDIKFINYDQKEAIEQLDQSQFDHFYQLVLHIMEEKLLGISQLNKIVILTKLEYFKDFGNITELLRILEIMEHFKFGKIKNIKSHYLDCYECLRDVFINNSTVTTAKSGTVNYKVEDWNSIFMEIEAVLLSLDLADMGYKEKLGFHFEFTGGLLPTNLESDRPILYVKELFSLHRKSDNRLFGYSITTQSLGSGKESRFTILSSQYNKNKFEVNDVIKCLGYRKDRSYFIMDSYKILN